MLALVILSSCSLQCFVSADDVFSSSAHLRLLADGEKSLVEALSNYLTTKRHRLEQLDKLVIIDWLIQIYWACFSSYARITFVG